jgi:hypothetical protein
LELVTLFLATVIGTAVSKALEPGAVVSNAIGGIIGNRVDAGFVKAVIGFVKGGTPNDQKKLQQAISRSMIAAQQSIIKECLKSQLSEIDRIWLKEQQQELKMQLVELENSLQEPVLIDSVALGKLLLPPDADGVVLEDLRGQLVRQVAELPEAPTVYLDLVRSSFFGRVCDCFGAEVRDRSELRDLLELQLLSQIEGQMLTIDRFITVLQSHVAQPLQEINTKLDKITDHLCPPGKTVFIESEFPANPFIPLNDRVEDPQHFFGQDKLIREIFEALKSSSVALVGEQGIGKSSILKEIKRISQQRLDRQVVYVDWNWVKNEEDFWGMVCDELQINLCTGIELIRAIQSRDFLLLLDHVEKMEHQIFVDEIMTQLRGLAEGKRRKVIIATCVSLDVLFTGTKYSRISPFQGLCEEHRMTKWSESVVRSYIQERLQATPVRFTTTEVQQIIQTSQGLPRLLVKQCHKLYKEYRDHHECR